MRKRPINVQIVKAVVKVLNDAPIIAITVLSIVLHAIIEVLSPKIVRHVAEVELLRQRSRSVVQVAEVADTLK